jgi:hypothetical protein
MISIRREQNTLLKKIIACRGLFLIETNPMLRETMSSLSDKITKNKVTLNIKDLTKNHFGCVSAMLMSMTSFSS